MSNVYDSFHSFYFSGKGNIVPHAEFNYYLDPEAVFIILNSLIRRILILPLDAYDEQISSVQKFKHSFIGLFYQSFIFHLQKWRFEVVGKVNGPNVDLLNKVEILPYRTQAIYGPFDAFAVAAFLFPKKIIEKCNPYNATMELNENSNHTRGEMFVNHRSTDYNVFVIEKISSDAFKNIMLWAANY